MLILRPPPLLLELMFASLPVLLTELDRPIDEPSELADELIEPSDDKDSTESALATLAAIGGVDVAAAVAVAALAEDDSEGSKSGTWAVADDESTGLFVDEVPLAGFIMFAVRRYSAASSRVFRAKSFMKLSLMAFVTRCLCSVIFAISASMSFLFCLFMAWISASCFFTMSLSLSCS